MAESRTLATCQELHFHYPCVLDKRKGVGLDGSDCKAEEAFKKVRRHRRQVSALLRRAKTKGHVPGKVTSLFSWLVL